MQHSGDTATQPGSTTSTIAQAGFDRSILYNGFAIISFSYRIYKNFFYSYYQCRITTQLKFRL